MQEEEKEIQNNPQTNVSDDVSMFAGADFSADFDDEYSKDDSDIPQLEEYLVEEEKKELGLEDEQETPQEQSEDSIDNTDNAQNVENVEGEKNGDTVQNEPNTKTDETPLGIEIDKNEELSCFEEYDKKNLNIKKYVFSISKELSNELDKIPNDERNAYVNSAIRAKVDLLDEQKQLMIKRKVMTHFILLIVIIIFSFPFMMLFVHKTIMLTFKNYKYSQSQFEKLYRQRFMQDKAYMRSIEYNKIFENKK